MAQVFSCTSRTEPTHALSVSLSISVSVSLFVCLSLGSALLCDVVVCYILVSGESMDYPLPWPAGMTSLQTPSLASSSAMSSGAPPPSYRVQNVGVVVASETPLT